MLVLDALREIDSIRQHADFRLENMGCCRYAMGHLPLVLPIQQRRFFLSTCQRDTKLFALIDTQRRLLEIAEDIRNSLVADRTPGYAAGWPGVVAVRQKLQRAYAVAPHSG